MVEKIAQHKHCRICSKAMPLDKEVCSEECGDKMDVIKKKQRYTKYLFYIMIFILIFLVMLQAIVPA